jgi:NhaP-type Na+/H+ and K+/H+ antiporter
MISFSSAHALPYTAVMFLIGTSMGIGAELVSNNSDNFLKQSIELWIDINSQVLLLIFLPGLIFRDAYSLNVHIFSIALVQCLIFAFPLVLAGTWLTALVAYYIFPYGWSFNLAMTFGSILSATDPVAVAALMDQLGAPPRLKVHISGEALLNDGAAIVFFEIFSERYLAELGVPGLGEDIDLAKGIAIFFRKALGSVAVGIFFGCGLLFILFILDKRLNREENVVEVSAVRFSALNLRVPSFPYLSFVLYSYDPPHQTIAIAYLGYYVRSRVASSCESLRSRLIACSFDRRSQRLHGERAAFCQL